MLPQGSVRLLATFQPPIPGLQYFDLTCKTLAGRVFRLAAKCDGLQPSVTLSHNVVRVSNKGAVCGGCSHVLSQTGKK